MLEDSLGSRLLTRTTRTVALTQAGSDLLEAARDVVDRADRLEADFRESQRDNASVLRIGAIDSAAVGLVPQLIPLFREAHPEIDIQLLEQKTIRLLPRLLTGRLDVAIVRPPEVLDPRLVLRSLFFETAVVAVPDTHPLAKKDRICVEDMADEPLIVPDKGSRPHSHDLTMKLFLEAGLPARVAQIAEEKQTIVNLVSTGVGIAIVPRWISRLAVGGVTFVPLDLPTGPAKNKLALSVAWVRDTRDSSRDALLQTLDQHVEQLAISA